ncbi:L-type lectin-domain containing receptor kinase VIII.2-like [Prunus yedoensis var. nudiflora]|uniref:L-type lectin-domain containing receptor kinase VIII.2-like n=1 Tax=Prunus yedoensis var. nudiflora TaxID=2094558 RepID=A0A314YVT5_PRUYE|nr:L-type lectin-domain containing receptor kinase VIII.2-like [Prunus yedoensis var. nudiflora]
MASLPFSKPLAAFVLLIFFLQPSAADSNSSFSFTEFGKGPKFESNIALYGDAEVVNGGYAVQLTSSVRSSAGRAMYKKPIKLSEGYGKGKFKVVAVKFNVLRDAKVHVGIDVGSSVSAKVSTSSSKNLNLTSGNKTHAWIDYEAGSDRLEVRLCQFGHPRPADPLLWYPIDLSKLWEHEKVFVGLSATNRNSSQTCLITSWSFEQRHVPHWMHSQPLDPKVLAKNSKPVRVETKKDCVKRVFGAMVFGVACGALASILALYLWTVFGNRRPVVPEGYAEQPKEFEYDKVKVGVDDKAIEDGKQ